MKDKPKQNWLDIAKGRLAAWGLVFTAFFTIDAGLTAVVGKDRKSGLSWFDWYEEKFGRLIASLTKSGQEIANTPVGHKLDKVQELNKPYQIGRILALDVYATTAGIFIWNLFSRRSATKRHVEQNGLPNDGPLEKKKSSEPEQPSYENNAPQMAALTSRSKSFATTLPSDNYAQDVSNEKAKHAGLGIGATS